MLLTISYIIIDTMPAQHKYSKYDNKKRYSSSSSSSYHRRDKDHKNYQTDKWRKKSRSRSHSNHKQENKHKFSYQSNQDDRKYHNKPYENKRDDSYRRKDSEQDHRRNDEKKNVSRFTFVRNEDRDRGYQQHRKEQKRQKNYQSIRYVSSSSKSLSKSPNRHRDNGRYNDSKFVYVKRSDNKGSNIQDKVDKNQNQQLKFKFQIKQKEQTKEKKDTKQTEDGKEKIETYLKETQNEKNAKYTDKDRNDNVQKSFPKPRFGFMMRPPFPPPPPIYRKFNEDFKRKNQFQLRNDEFKREEKQIVLKQQKRKDYKDQMPNLKSQIISKTISQPQLPKLTPIRRLNEVKQQIKNEIIMADVCKEKVSPFEMLLYEAKANLFLPTPPINFMSIDTFKNMNKFQIETLDKRWVSSLKQELQKPQQLKKIVQCLAQVSEQQKKESRLWTYLKEQRNEQQQNLKMKLQQLRVINSGLHQMIRKLPLLQR